MRPSSKGAAPLGSDPSDHVVQLVGERSVHIASALPSPSKRAHLAAASRLAWRRPTGEPVLDHQSAAGRREWTKRTKAGPAHRHTSTGPQSPWAKRLARLPADGADAEGTPPT
jgi:hypothetical protein